jgi:hypothetical protein
MIFSRKAVFLTIILLIGVGGAVFLGARALKLTVIPTIQSETIKASVVVADDGKGAEQTAYGIPLQKPDPTLKPTFSEENFPGWKLLYKHNLTTTTPDYPGLQNVQEMELRYGSNGDFATIHEYAIAHRDYFEQYLKDHAVPGQEAQLDFWIVPIQGKDPEAGAMVYGKNRAVLVEQHSPWQLFSSKDFESIISMARANANGEFVVATTSTVPSIEFVSNSLLSKKLLESFHLHLDYASDKNVSDEFEHMHEIQTAGVTTSKGNPFFMDEFVINDREALRGAFGDPVLYVGTRPLYSVRAPGLVPFTGFMLLGEKKALFLSLNGKDWNLDMTDSDVVNFLQNVPLP